MLAQLRDLIDLDDLYQESILDHYHNPRNSGTLESPDISARVDNPFCGDQVTVQARVEGGRISAVKTQSIGCSLTVASASMMSEHVQGKSLENIQRIHRSLKDLLYGKQVAPADMEALKPLDTFSQVRQFPIRIKCVLLAWMALEDGLRRLHA